MNRPIRVLTPEAFAPYGRVLELPPDAPDGFHVLLDQPDAPGWAFAITQVTRRYIDVLGAHPNTKETFEPFQGVALIAVARPDQPDTFEVFLLDRPVCVNEDVWHANCALSAVALLKTTENTQVVGVTHELRDRYLPEFGPVANGEA